MKKRMADDYDYEGRILRAWPEPKRKAMKKPKLTELKAPRAARN